jgi:hypothetical protein
MLPERRTGATLGNMYVSDIQEDCNGKEAIQA